MNQDTVKPLKCLVKSTPTGCNVTYPTQENKSHDIEKPLQTFISCIAACQISILRLYSKKLGFKLGQINLTKVDSTFDTALLHGEGGPQNRIGDVFIEGEVETDLEQEAFQEVEKKIKTICPIFQTVMASGSQIHTKLKVKKID